MTTRESSTYMTNMGVCTVTGVFNEDYKLVEISITIKTESDSWSVKIIDQEPELVREYMGIKEGLQRLDGFTYSLFQDSDPGLKMNVCHSDRYIDFDKTFVLSKS